jgi:prepilin-type N-terminal cleavage/methylation domain-containing protein
MKPKKAFTLIELLVVISIIALLLSILMPSLQRVKDLASRVVCSSNLKQQGIAFGTYAAEYEKYPHEVHQVFGNNGNLLGAHWPFGGMSYVPQGENEYQPAAQGALLAADYITNPEFFYCPSLTKNDFLSYENMFEQYQRDYIENNDLEYIDWEYLYISYPYWVKYRTGNTLQDRNLKSSVADSPTDRSNQVIATDIIAVSGDNLSFGDFSDAYKYPHQFANHTRGSVMQGGSVLTNDGAVEWQDFRSMQDDWGSVSPLKYNRLRFRYTATDNILFWF